MDKIISGVKTVEIRVQYPNYRDIVAGQLIEFLSEERSCLTKVVRVDRYDSFEEMLNSENPRAIGYEEGLSHREMLERLRKIYPPTKEALGVLVIEIRKADSLRQ